MESHTMSERLYDARKAADLSRPQLAKAVGVSRGAVAHWETGRVANIRPEHLLKVCEVLGVEVAWLVRGQGPRKSRKSAAERRLEARWLAVKDAISDAQFQTLLANLESRIELERDGLLPPPNALESPPEPEED